MKEYFLSVICAAILCAVATSLLEKKTGSGKLLKLISGTVLTFTVLAPVAEVKLEDLTFYLEDLSAEGEAVASMGQTQYSAAMASIIKQETEAYILDKARDLQGELTAEVSLDTECIPSSVILAGQISAQGKQELEKIIARDLGIAKEDQQWKVS